MLECMSKSDSRTWCGARKSDLDLWVHRSECICMGRQALHHLSSTCTGSG